MIEYVIAAKEDMELLMQSSLDATPSVRPLYKKWVLRNRKSAWC